VPIVKVELSEEAHERKLEANRRRKLIADKKLEANKQATVQVRSFMVRVVVGFRARVGGARCHAGNVGWHGVANHNWVTC
jgi:hypothetical protein